MDLVHILQLKTLKNDSASITHLPSEPQSPKIMQLLHHVLRQISTFGKTYFLIQGKIKCQKKNKKNQHLECRTLAKNSNQPILVA